MAQMVNKCKIEFNGYDFDDIDNVTEMAYEKAMPVELMNKTGYAEKTARYGFSINAIKAAFSPFKLDDVVNGVATIVYDSGERVIYGGVVFTGRGDQSVDGNTPASATYTFSAISRNGDRG